MKNKNLKKMLILSVPYILIGAFATNLGEAWRLAEGTNLSEKIQGMVLGGGFSVAFANPLPSLYLLDLVIGIIVGAILRLAVYLKGKNAKKYRHNVEYGSARWGTQADIEPFVDSTFENNVLLSQTERITMNGRPAEPKYARNKNVLVVGGSGSVKRDFLLSPIYFKCILHIASPIRRVQ